MFLFKKQSRKTKVADNQIMTRYPIWRIIIFPVSISIVTYVWVKKKIWRLLFRKKPIINSIFLDRFGDKVREIRAYPGTARALDLIYNHVFGINKFDDFWFSGKSAHAVRNRFKLVKQELRTAIIATGKKEVRVLEVASGSAQALLEVSLELMKHGIEVSTLLLDRDESALDDASRLYTHNGIKHQLRTVNATSSMLTEAIGDFNPDIVEIVGLIDYLDNEKIERLLKRVGNSISNQSILITSNIVHNSERLLLHTMYDWPRMFYRSSRTVEKILKGAGFVVRRSYYEPFGIFCIVVAQKKGDTTM